MSHRIAMLTWLPGYRKEWLSADLLAGVSVAAVALPVALAYSHLAGVPAIYGLYASLLPLIAYALFGSSRQLIVAPDAATCAIVAAVVVPLAGADPLRYLALTAALAMLTGLICIVAGLARLGFITNFLARPILTGYLNGIAICIVAGQLGGLFGFTLQPAGFFRLIWHFLSQLGATHWPTLAVGTTTLALLLALSRWAPRVPGALIALIGGIAASMLLDFSAFGIKLLGHFPAGLPLPKIPAIGWHDWEALASGALGLAFVLYNSAMVTARGFAAKNRYDIDANREFIALGFANIGAGILQGYAVSGADSRTAMNDAMGGKSQLTGLVAAAVLALILLFLTGPLQWLPSAVLAAVLVKAGIGLFDLRGLMLLRRLSPPEFRLCLLTILGVITVGVLPGVAVAVGVALLQLLVRASRPHDALLGRIPDSAIYCDTATHAEAQSLPGLMIYRFDSALLFFNADHFKARVKTLVASAPQAVRAFVLDAETMPFVDTTGVAAIDALCADFRDAGISFAVAAAKSPVRAMLERSGLSKKIGADRMFPTVAAAAEGLGPRSNSVA
jgi:high affinity sulfate transporter 1